MVFKMLDLRKISPSNRIQSLAKTQEIPLTLMIRGAGGGGGYAGSGVGGAGGMSSGTYIAKDTDSFFVVVGQGGSAIAPNGGTGSRPTGGGGLAGNLGYGGQGGGYSGLFLNSATQSNALLIAGGGGGASYEDRSGGAGGGASGASGAAAADIGGTGGTQSAGGTGGTGTVAGSALQGGDCSSSGDGGGGGGGGGGYFGGGAGSGSNPGSAGGGGSSFASSIIFSPVLTQGSGGAGGSGTSSGSSGSVTISFSRDSGKYLNVGNGLTYTSSVFSGIITYTITAGSGTITFESFKIITSSLVLHLDASNSTSYPGSGSSWFDISGNNNNATMFGNTVYSPANEGIMVFDGSGDYLEIADSISMELTSNQMSIEVWVNFSQLKGYQAILSKPGASDGNGWVLYTETNNVLHFLAGNAGTWTIVLSSGVVPVTNTWYHIVVTRNSSNVWTYYLNNVSRATTTNSFSIPDLATPTSIARYINFPGANLNQTLSGRIGEIRIYKGYALTASDVNNNFNAEKSKYMM